MTHAPLIGAGQGRFAAPDFRNLKEDGIHIQRHKTAGSTCKRTIYEWKPELRAAVELTRQARPVLPPFLFCNRPGEVTSMRKPELPLRLGQYVGTFHGSRISGNKRDRAFHGTRSPCQMRVGCRFPEHARALLSQRMPAQLRRFTGANPNGLYP